MTTYTYTTTDEQDAVMAAKVAVMQGQTMGQLFDGQLTAYIDACRRDVKMDLDALAQAKLAAMDTASKQAWVTGK